MFEELYVYAYFKLPKWVVENSICQLKNRSKRTQKYAILWAQSPNYIEWFLAYHIVTSTQSMIPAIIYYTKTRFYN